MTDTLTRSADSGAGFPSTLNAALAELQMQLPHVAKDNTAKVPTKSGGEYRYKYADLAQISRDVLPVLGKLGLAFTSRPTMAGEQLVLMYELRHVSGECIEGMYPLPLRGTPQEIGSAITYARRYCLCAVTGVAPDNDDEDAVIAESAARKRRVEEVAQKVEADAQPRISAEQARDLQSLFGPAGVPGDKASRLQFAMTVVKRQIGSATELTQNEADQVIGALRTAAQKRAEQAPAEGEPS